MKNKRLGNQELGCEGLVDIDFTVSEVVNVPAVEEQEDKDEEVDKNSLERLLKSHDFNFINNWRCYRRENIEKVDYLFLESLANEKGTVGMSLDPSESKGFDNFLDKFKETEIYKDNKKLPIGLYSGVYGNIAGGVIGFLSLVPFLAYGLPFNGLELLLLGSSFYGTGVGYLIGKRVQVKRDNKYDKLVKRNEELKDTFTPFIKSSPEQYDLDIVKNVLYST